jgi:hypothetical protein
MKGRLAWLISAALLSATMILGGCVAESADEDEALGQTSAPISIAPPVDHQAPVSKHPPNDTGTNPPMPIDFQEDDGSDQQGNTNSETGNAVEPEPNPWQPQTTATTGSNGDDGSGHRQRTTLTP